MAQVLVTSLAKGTCRKGFWFFFKTRSFYNIALGSSFLTRFLAFGINKDPSVFQHAKKMVKILLPYIVMSFCICPSWSTALEKSFVTKHACCYQFLRCNGEIDYFFFNELIKLIAICNGLNYVCVNIVHSSLSFQWSQVV